MPYELALGLVAVSLGAGVFQFVLPGKSVLTLSVAVLLVVVGLTVLVTGLFEEWLNRIQPALVYGLQAG